MTNRRQIRALKERHTRTLQMCPLRRAEMLHMVHCGRCQLSYVRTIIGLSYGGPLPTTRPSVLFNVCVFCTSRLLLLLLPGEAALTLQGEAGLDLVPQSLVHQRVLPAVQTGPGRDPPSTQGAAEGGFVHRLQEAHLCHNIEICCDPQGIYIYTHLHTRMHAPTSVSFIRVFVSYIRCVSVCVCA